MIVSIGHLRLDVDIDATRAAYLTSASAACSCNTCHNLRTQMPAALGPAARAILARLGIDETKAAELIHYARNPAGGHLYQVVFGFFGRAAAAGVVPASQPGSLDPFMVVVEPGRRLVISESTFPLQPAFRGPTALHLDLQLEGVPWVIPGPEPD